MLVRRGGEEIWIPYSGESAEEIEELIEEAGNPPEEPRVDVRAGAPQRARPVRRSLSGWASSSPSAWRSGSSRAGPAGTRSTGAPGSRRLSASPPRHRASRRSRWTIYCDESRDFVGAVQHADGVAEVGGERAYLTPEICLDLYRLAFEAKYGGARRLVRSPFSYTRRGIFVASPTRGRPSATRCSRASRSAVASASRRGPRASSCGNSWRRTRCAAGGSVEYRVPAECRDGGRLDLDAASTAISLAGAAARSGGRVGSRASRPGPTAMWIAAGSRIHAIRPRAVRSSSRNWNACA